MGLPPNSVLLAPRRRSAHALEWSRKDDKRYDGSDPPGWIHMRLVGAAAQDGPEVVSRRFAAQHVPTCVQNQAHKLRRGRGERDGNQRAMRPMRLQEVHSLALDVLRELEPAKAVSRRVDAWPAEKNMPAPPATVRPPPKRVNMRPELQAVPTHSRMLPPIDSRPSSAPAPPSPSMLRGRQTWRRASTPLFSPYDGRP
uniref:Uncharacterized protein n=1 Tax=Prymnesium polylepis TaxID=72548 RepID=A0A6V4W9A6_9EUKA|mmetsp:Transcript_46431/g.128999  ORF Transcript_46431/g.128999 Transcript_46431/m.128999 type:complete len:198 (-) Transcript_46431:124-717(-)